MHALVRSVSEGVAALHATDVDRQARFPAETLQALREAHVLSAQVPVALGGIGLTMRELGELVGTLARGCSASAMILSMHFNQLACLLRHGLDQPPIDDFIRELVARQWLIASMTSEEGTFGDTRQSICAVETDGETYVLAKRATTGSYCAHADAILVTARRTADSARSDQVLVMVRRTDAELTVTSSWDTLGMRGTCSPGYELKARGPVGCVLAAPYAEISTQSMVPYSHILWAALWCGIATEARARAAAFVRGQARRAPGTVPPTAQRLAELTAKLQSMRHDWQAQADQFDAAVRNGSEAEEFGSMRWSLQMNGLKIACSEAAPLLVHSAMQVIGILSYKNDSPFSLGRLYRDALSAALMISNDRLIANSAAMLIVLKDE